MRVRTVTILLTVLGLLTVAALALADLPWTWRSLGIGCAVVAYAGIAARSYANTRAMRRSIESG
jgi:hypothetical protein